MSFAASQNWVTEGLEPPAERFRPVDDSYVKPPLKAPPSTAVSKNLDGARTDSELFQALSSHKDKTVVVKYGSSFCFKCQQMLPHFMRLSREYPDNHYIVAQLDNMKDGAQGIKFTPTYAFFKQGLKVDQFVPYDPQRLDDHLWLHTDS